MVDEGAECEVDIDEGSHVMELRRSNTTGPIGSRVEDVREMVHLCTCQVVRFAPCGNGDVVALSDVPSRHGLTPQAILNRIIVLLKSAVVSGMASPAIYP